MIDLDEPVLDFTAMDRCDRCGAQAGVLASMDNSRLMFCAHHFREHKNALSDNGWTLHFDRTTLEDLGVDVDELIGT